VGKEKHLEREVEVVYIFVRLDSMKKSKKTQRSKVVAREGKRNPRNRSQRNLDGLKNWEWCGCDFFMNPIDVVVFSFITNQRTLLSAVVYQPYLILTHRF